MTNFRPDRRPSFRWMRSRLLSAGLLLYFLAHASCLPCGVFRRELILEARVIDEESGNGLSDTPIGGSIFTDDEEWSYRDPLGPRVDADRLPPGADGSFRLRFRSPALSEVCGVPPFQRVVYDPPLPTPDRLELIVVRDTCEQRVSIDLNEETVVDMTFPGDLLELAAPIRLAPCP